MVYDLHCHSNASDGELSPLQLVSRAIDKGVRVLAITDHDTVAAYTCLDNRYDKDYLTLIPGIEISAVWRRQSIHVVGLNINLHLSQLAEIVQSQAQVRECRARMIGDKLAKRGINDAYEEALKLADGGMIGRPHFAQFLMSSGYVKSLDEAFNRYLGDTKLSGLNKNWPDLEQAVGWITDLGGIAVLAHPNKYKLTRTKLHQLLSDFKTAGGQAMEVISGSQTPDVTDNLADVCISFDLYASCGSDFHSPQQQWIELGKFSNLPKKCRPVWSLWET